MGRQGASGICRPDSFLFVGSQGEVAAEASGILNSSLSCPQEDAPDGFSRRLRRVTISVFLRVYPFVHATWEGARFAYQLAYLLDYSPFYAPGLHLLRQHIVRVSGMEMVLSLPLVVTRILFTAEKII